MKKDNGFDALVYEKQVNICKAFANPIRLRILDLIAQRSYAACELQEELSISRANLSQHMTTLKAAGVVTTHRKGKQVYCALAIPEVKHACELIRKVLRAQIRWAAARCLNYFAFSRSPIQVNARIAEGNPRVVIAKSPT